MTDSDTRFVTNMKWQVAFQTGYASIKDATPIDDLGPGLGARRDYYVVLGAPNDEVAGFLRREFVARWSHPALVSFCLALLDGKYRAACRALEKCFRDSKFPPRNGA